MGVHPNISHAKFPKQGDYYGHRCRVLFNYSEPEILGRIVRDDVEDPFLTIIHLDDGRHVLTTECQYSPFEPPEPAGRKALEDDR